MPPTQKRKKVVIARHEALLRRLGLTTLEQVKAFHGELVKDHLGQRDIFRIAVTDSDRQSRVLFLKRTWRPYKKDGIATLLRHGRVWSIARQEWENCRALETAGLRVSPLVAYGEDCGPFWEHFSFIITEAATGPALEDFLRDGHDRDLRRDVFDALAREVRRLHDAGLATPDLFTRHVFVDTAGGEPKFCFIDMTRLDRARTLSLPTRARDLAALNITAPVRLVSARERIRFLKIYAGKVDRDLIRRIGRRMAQLLGRRKFRDFHAAS